MQEINRIPKRWINQPNGVAGLDDVATIPRRLNDVGVQRSTAPIVNARLRVIADCGPSEITGTNGAGKIAPFAGRTGWTSQTDAVPAIEPDYVYRYGNATQSMKITTNNTNMRAPILAMPETTIDPGDYLGTSLPTVKSCLEFVWRTDDYAAIDTIEIRLYESSTRYRRCVLDVNGMWGERLGVVNGEWIKWQLHSLRFQLPSNNSNGANVPSPWGWGGNESTGATYDAGTDRTTITCRLEMFEPEHVGRGVCIATSPSQASRREILSVVDSQTITVAGDATTAAANGNPLFLMVPFPHYPVQEIRVAISAKSGQTATIYVGGIYSVECDQAIFMPEIDDLYLSGASFVVEESAKYADLGFVGKGNFLVTERLAGGTSGGEQLYLTWENMRDYERMGYSIVAHGKDHLRTNPASGVCNVSGTTVTRTSGTSFVSDGGAGGWSKHRIRINGVTYNVVSVANASTLTIDVDGGTQNGVAWRAAVSEETLEHEHRAVASAIRRNGLRDRRPIFNSPPHLSSYCEAWGKCTVAAGVVTRADGDVFYLGDGSHVQRIELDGTWYTVASVQSPTQLTLADTSITEESPVNWVIADGAYGVARRNYAMVTNIVRRRAVSNDYTLRFNQAAIPRDPFNISRVSITTQGSQVAIDDVGTAGYSYAEQIEYAIAMGSLYVFYSHAIREGATDGDSEPQLWRDVYAMIAEAVRAGQAVMWNADDLYAFLNGNDRQEIYWPHEPPRLFV